MPEHIVLFKIFEICYKFVDLGKSLINALINEIIASSGFKP